MGSCNSCLANDQNELQIEINDNQNKLVDKKDVLNQSSTDKEDKQSHNLDQKPSEVEPQHNHLHQTSMDQAFQLEQYETVNEIPKITNPLVISTLQQMGHFEWNPQIDELPVFPKERIFVTCLFKTSQMVFRGYLHNQRKTFKCQ